MVTRMSELPSIASEVLDRLLKGDDANGTDERRARTRLYRLWTFTIRMHPHVDRAVLYEVTMLAYAHTLPMMHEYAHALVMEMKTMQEHTAHLRMLHIIAVAKADQRRPLEKELATDDDWGAWMNGL